MGNFIDELKWRGLIHDSTPGIQEHLSQNIRSAYIGFDPTSDSLHIGSLVPIILLAHFQKSGHQPIALIGGATGMIGDPSGKSNERNLLDETTLKSNQKGIKEQLSQFLSFDKKLSNHALILNNYDWMKDFSFLDFIRDIGKHITINYMMAKDSVKKRIGKESNDGMSFTEFTYQLIQGYDFLYLFQNMNCTVQMGGSDQWGNITTGTELIRRKENKKAFALTCPLVTKSDGSKFGKSESGNIWLDKNKTSAYKFYQYWINISDEDAKNYIKIFTFLEKNEVEKLIKQHDDNKGLRILQNHLADSLTKLIHGDKELQNSVKASKILFGKSSEDDLKSVDPSTIMEIFEGVPKSTISSQKLKAGIDIEILLSKETNFLKSLSEAKRALSENSIYVNKTKVQNNFVVSDKNLINNKLILLQRGKKNYFLVNIK